MVSVCWWEDKFCFQLVLISVFFFLWGAWTSIAVKEIQYQVAKLLMNNDSQRQARYPHIRCRVLNDLREYWWWMAKTSTFRTVNNRKNEETSKYHTGFCLRSYLFLVGSNVLKSETRLLLVPILKWLFWQRFEDCFIASYLPGALKCLIMLHYPWGHHGDLLSWWSTVAAS